MKKITSIVLSLIFPVFLLAVDKWTVAVEEWGVEYDFVAQTYLFNHHPQKNDVVIEAKISQNIEGKQVLYINEFLVSHNLCEVGYTNDERFYFNKRAVKMVSMCKLGDRNNYLEYSFENHDSMMHVINLFKKSSKNIILKTPTLKVSISSTGFSREWDKFSDEIR
ncbi:MAG: hypothetical protein DRG78_15105 [Epsilonproteobacteria bacterium]|nr:MAG: hypothetical protein DRG78_15105 [Campylobacterota bacterium]